MSILSDTAHENMINSEAAVTYILKALFSDVFKFDGTTEVMISENIKRGCPHIWKDPNYRIISDKLFHWWLSDMPYIYLAMLEDQKFVPVLYENLKKIVEYDKNHSLDYMMKTKMFSLQNYAQVLFFMLILQTSMKLCTRNYLQIWKDPCML